MFLKMEKNSSFVMEGGEIYLWAWSTIYVEVILGYEASRILGCSAIWVLLEPTFRRKISLPYLGRKKSAILLVISKAVRSC
jgi:hypothetical protein